MEKKTNKFYKAVSVLDFVFAGLGFAFLLFAIIGMIVNNAIIQEILDAAIAEGYDPSTGMGAATQISYSIVVAYIVFFAIIGVAECVVMIIAGVQFGKLSEMTDEEAASTYGKAMAWSIVSFFFGGLLMGGLALGGLLTTHQTQKNNYMNATKESLHAKETQTASKKEDPLSPENMERARERLVKLNSLKESGALNEDEYERLRKEIVGTIDPSLNLDPKKQARIKKLEELKASGAINEEEFNNLKNTILNDF